MVDRRNSEVTVRQTAVSENAFLPFSRFCELSDWLSSQRRQALLLKEMAMNSRHREQVDAAVQVSKHVVFAPVGT